MNTKHYLVISGIIGGVIGSLMTESVKTAGLSLQLAANENRRRSSVIMNMAGVSMSMVRTGYHMRRSK